MAEKSEPYRDWRSIAQAIKAAAGKAVDTGAAGQVSDQIVQAHFDRFLSRVFSDGDDSEWLLKGGTAMLARVPRTRTTRDLDLASSATSMNSAITALEDLAARDLDDHIQFRLTGTRPTGRGDNQPGVQTVRAVFSATDADTEKPIGTIHIDIVVGPPPVGTIETLDPAHRLPLPRLASHPYRLFPIADQTAEKVCATMSTNYPQGRPSSRVKDLVDLVVILKTQRVNLRELQQAISAKQALSRMDQIDEFHIPDGWQTTYRTLARTTPAVDDVTDAGQAEAIVADFLRPALTDQPVTDDTEWVPGRGWSPPDTPDPTPADPQGDVFVRGHVRSGRPVAQHWRSNRNP